MTEVMDELVGFFKAVADETRLRIVGLLSQQPRSVDELATMLGLTAPTVSHHLSRLQAIGLVEARAQQYYNIYSLRIEVLHEMARRLLSTDELTRIAGDVDQDAFSKKVLANFLERGRLKEIPRQLKKKQAVVQWLAGHFEPGERYTERQVNQVLGVYHDDFATLRRELVNMKFLAREEGVYWRADSVVGSQ
jgi:DNA-binding transcriptional ArsR family regulator